MRKLTTAIACLPLAVMLTACGNSQHSESAGYTPPPNPSPSAGMHPRDPGRAYDDYYAEYEDPYPDNHVRRETRVTTVFDENGHRVIRDTVSENSYSVPVEMMPPRGKCRVWFANRAPDKQPGSESCEGIRQRAPEGSYIIYGY